MVLPQLRVGFRGLGFWGLPIGCLVVPFWDYPYRILNVNHKKELLRSLWVGKVQDFFLSAFVGFHDLTGPSQISLSEAPKPQTLKTL